MGVEEVKGSSPSGASSPTGPDGRRLPSKIVKVQFYFYGKHVTEIAKKISA